MSKSSMSPLVAVAYAPGTNCHEETIWAIQEAGGRAELVLLHDLVSGRSTLDKYRALVFPGGFAYGDHVAAGRVFAVQVVARLKERLGRFVEDRPVMGICNGYQVLTETGLLPGGTLGKRTEALAQNISARFESRWVSLRVVETGTFWTQGIEGGAISMPVAHAEGRMLLAPGATCRPAFLYADVSGVATESYPANPAGSPGGVAGVCSANGMALGMMPHPERAALSAHGSTDGLALFRNLVSRCRE